MNLLTYFSHMIENKLLSSSHGIQWTLTSPMVMKTNLIINLNTHNSFVKINFNSVYSNTWLEERTYFCTCEQMLNV